MVSFSVEVQCPQHGLERFRIKILKRVNIPSKKIMPKVRMRPKPGEISCLYVGRDISYEEAKKYLIGYFRESNIGEIVRIKMVT